MTLIILRMLGSAVCIIAIMLVFYLLDKRTALGRCRQEYRQLLYGLVFSVLTVSLLQFGADVQGSPDNIQDVVPLCTGLVFGVPAGILTGVLGAALAAGISGGGFTGTSVIVALLMAGFMGGILRYFLFDDKKSSDFYGLAAGLVMAVLHMLILLLLHLGNLKEAYAAIHMLALPLMLISAITAMLVLRLVAWASGVHMADSKGGRGIAEIFQRWLLICVVAAFTVTCVYSWLLQTSLAETAADNLLRLNIQDVQNDIQETSDTELLKIARRVAGRITPANYQNDRPGEMFHNEQLLQLMEEFDLTDINLINRSGINAASTNGTFCGYNMASGKQSAAFLVLLNGTPEMVQNYQPISSDASISRKYAGVALQNGGFVQVGYGAAQFQASLHELVSNFTDYVHIGETGGVLIVDANGMLVSDSGGAAGKSLRETGMVLPENVPEHTRFQMTVHGQASLCMYVDSEGYTILAYYPLEEVMLYRNAGGYSVIFMEIILFAVIFLLIYFLVKKLVVDNIHKINLELAKISNGNLDTRVDVHTNEEFTSLSHDINTTVDTLKRYIAEAAARIDQELEFARTIQLSLLPMDFPEQPAFDIFANMQAAREVGGDFYDFYLLNETKLVFLIADVSGKGIPAAMFMMRSKTLLKSLIENGLSPADAFTQANAELSEHNDACMFVTAWMGMLDLSTGHVDFVNAGHNPPLLVRRDGPGYLKSKAGFVLGAMPGMKYKTQQLELAPDDVLFLYTDGLTEAMDLKNQLYGQERPLEVLRRFRDMSARNLEAAMRQDVAAYVGAAEQSDDLTMLVLRYTGQSVKNNADH